MRCGSSIRWAFNFRSWEPTEQEWLLAAQCVQVEEKQRIGKFAFKKDAKASMVGRLMIRKYAHLATGVPYEQIIVERDDFNRPFIKNCCVALDFNVSHQGNYAVFAGEIQKPLKVGVDIMSIERKTGHQLSEFFRLMRRQMSEDEWNTIVSFASDEKKAATFFRLWSLKESYLKAVGVGLNLHLHHLSFTLNTLPLPENKFCDDTTVRVDNVMQTGWKFHEWMIDSEHCVAVALYSPTGATVNVEPVPFTVLSWSELMNEAKPFIPLDSSYCQEFLSKDEHPD